MLWVKDFKGHSGCKVQLYNNNGQYLIRKSGSVKLKESATILQNLKNLGFNTPDIYFISDSEIHMQYINGLDMKTFIHNATANDIKLLTNFIDQYISCFINYKNESIISNVVKKLQQIEETVDTRELVFSTSELLEKLPTLGRTGLIHGDFTLENIMFFDNKFYLIDANPTDINAIEFDANKIRQDLDCLWFVRDQANKLSYKIVCDKISFHLKNKWSFLNDNYILIFMLMRILPYCKDNTTKNFIIKEINRLWQL